MRPVHGRLRRAGLLLVFAALVGCGGGPPPVATTLSALKAAQDDFDGRRVIVSGTLRSFDDPEHYWIENSALDRVALEADEPLQARVGEVLEVHGRFTYDRDEGRRIDVELIVPQG